MVLLTTPLRTVEAADWVTGSAVWSGKLTRMRKTFFFVSVQALACSSAKASSFDQSISPSPPGSR